MNVYRMNECDWVCAETEEQAKAFYKKEVGFDDDEIEEDFMGEVSLQGTMVDLDDDGNFVKRTFEEVIVQDNITEPCIICSTEY